MNKLPIALVGMAALIASVAPGSYFSWPATPHVTPLVLGAGNLGVSPTLSSYAGKNPVVVLMLAAAKNRKNGGGQKDGDDKGKAEKDDKSQDKDKDGGGGWDRVWDAPKLG